MANTKAKTATEEVAATETAATDTTMANENMNAEEVVENKQENKPTAKKKSTKTTEEKQVAPAPLEKDDEIEVVSLIPNVSYKDSHTGDMYKWEKAGDIVIMDFETVQRMWQRHKSYFKSMWLKPCDDRVVKKFSLSSTYDKYDFLMDKDNYTKKNIDKICDSIKATPASLKLSLCNKVKDMVANGEVTDIGVLRAIEINLNIDLISLVD